MYGSAARRLLLDSAYRLFSPFVTPEIQYPLPNHTLFLRSQSAAASASGFGRELAAATSRLAKPMARSDCFLTSEVLAIESNRSGLLGKFAMAFSAMAGTASSFPAWCSAAK